MYFLGLSYSFDMLFLRLGSHLVELLSILRNTVGGMFWLTSFRLGKLSFCFFCAKNENLLSLSIPILSGSLFANS